MEPVREITREEFWKLTEEMKEEAKILGQKAVEKGWKFPDSYSPELYFYNRYSIIPCLYRLRRTAIGKTEFNPLTGKEVKCKPVPIGYKLQEKQLFSFIHHLTLDGCPKIVPFETVVRCAFTEITDGTEKFFICEHLVGDCPAKE